MVSFSSVVLSGLRDRSSYFAGRSHFWLERKKSQSLAQGDWLFIPTSLSCFAGQGCRSTTQPVVSPYKVTDKIYRAVAEPARRIARLANSSAPAAVATARRRARSSNKFSRCLVYSTAGCSLTASFSTATVQPWYSI